MNQGQRYCLYTTIAGMLLCCNNSYAVNFEPGVGAGVEYTDNARLTTDDTINELITVGYVGARLTETDGPLNYNASASFNNQSYTDDTFSDKRYFNLAANAGWEMIKHYFDWTMSDYFSQRTVDTLDNNTPDNLQDSNTFTFGANIKLPVSQRNSFKLVPLYSKYYYETQTTDNEQYAVTANWNYQMFRLTNVGFSLSTREINYSEKNLTDTTFNNISIIINGQGIRSNYSLNLGSTNVKRGDDEGSSGFAGGLNWLSKITSHSKYKINLSTELTDTSSAASYLVENPDDGNANEIQISTDVLRNSVANISYLREDDLLRSRIWLAYRKLTYSDSPQDRIVKTFGLNFNYPVTRLLSTGIYASYNQTDQLDTNRIDEQYVIGGTMKYRFSRKLHSLFEVKYRTKDSTNASQNHEESSVFLSLVYGFGDLKKPSRSGGL